MLYQVNADCSLVQELSLYSPWPTQDFYSNQDYLTFALQVLKLERLSVAEAAQ